VIKYGAHSYMFTENWSDNSLPILDTVKSLGTDVFEIGVGDDLRFTPSLIRNKANELGISLTTGPGGVWPLKCDLSSEDPKERSMGLDWHKRIVDITADIGAFAYCGATYGHPGVVKKRTPLEREYAWTAEGLHLLAEYAEKSGIAIALEPMSHFRTHVVNTPEQLMKLIGLADHRNLKALLDTYHMITEVRDYSAAIHTVKDRLIGFHACENDRGCPGGGLVPWHDVFKALKEIAFDGFVMLETYNSSIDDFAFRRRMFHNVCPDPEAFINQGFDFIRSGLRLYQDKYLYLKYLCLETLSKTKE